MQQVDKNLKTVGMICEEFIISYLLWFLVVSTKSFFFSFLKLPTNPLTSTYSDWDSDMSSVMLLLHLLPPLRKKTFQQRLLTDLCISIR